MGLLVPLQELRPSPQDGAAFAGSGARTPSIARRIRGHQGRHRGDGRLAAPLVTLPAAPHLGAFRVPATWALIREFDGPLTGYRDEPRRLWARVGRRGRSAALLAERPTREAKRELLHELSNGATTPVAAEVGEALLRERAGGGAWRAAPWDGPRPGAQRPLVARGAPARGAPRGRDRAFRGARRHRPLALTAAATHRLREGTRWAARLRERFSGHPRIRSSWTSESGLAEGVTMYHTAGWRTRGGVCRAHRAPGPAHPSAGAVLSSRSRSSAWVVWPRRSSSRDAYKAVYGRGCGLARAVLPSHRGSDPARPRRGARDPGRHRDRFPTSFWAGEGAPAARRACRARAPRAPDRERGVAPMTSAMARSLLRRLTLGRARARRGLRGRDGSAAGGAPGDFPPRRMPSARRRARARAARARAGGSRADAASFGGARGSTAPTGSPRRRPSTSPSAGAGRSLGRSGPTAHHISGLLDARVRDGRADRWFLFQLGFGPSFHLPVLVALLRRRRGAARLGAGSVLRTRRPRAPLRAQASSTAATP